MKNNLHVSDVKILIDGFQVANASFIFPEARVIEVDSEEANKFLKSRFDFSGEITLGRNAERRLKRLFRKHWRKQWRKNLLVVGVGRGERAAV